MRHNIRYKFYTEYYKPYTNEDVALLSFSDKLSAGIHQTPY